MSKLCFHNTIIILGMRTLEFRLNLFYMRHYYCTLTSLLLGYTNNCDGSSLTAAAAASTPIIIRSSLLFTTPHYPPQNRYTQHTVCFQPQFTCDVRIYGYQKQYEIMWQKDIQRWKQINNNQKKHKFFSYKTYNVYHKIWFNLKKL